MLLMAQHMSLGPKFMKRSGTFDVVDCNNETQRHRYGEL